MSEGKVFTAIGLMSGTSMDGIDAALIHTDGHASVRFGPSLTVAYEDAFKDRVRQVLGQVDRTQPAVQAVERELTRLHADAVARLMVIAGVHADEVDIVGFHGHTVHHDPKNRVTVQLGDGQALANAVRVAVACDFRSRDVTAGGEGAPLVPVFHAALVRAAAHLPTPAAVLNIGGVANVTWVGDTDVLAFDTGPGNAPLNDWMHAHTGRDMDRGGAVAAQGRVDGDVLNRLAAHPYFDRKPPKSLDRQDFTADLVAGLDLADGAATLTALIARAVLRATEHFPAPAHLWIVTGGGSHNPVVMKALRDALRTEVRSAADMGWDGDALEAQAFAYLAVRSVLGLPISFPTTTGVGEPMVGGQVFRPQ